VAKTATIKYGWTRSASADVEKVITVLTVNGITTTTERGPEVESFTVDVAANSSVTLRVDSYDSEGLVALSEVYSHTVGNLELPLPATGLYHQILAVNDVPDPVTPG
jgi:hypothetical protein